MPTYLRDLITIPERSTADDYVLRLAENVGARASAALADYVVTDQLAGAFDTALGLVEQALASGESKGAYLAGSFGSGKSHFMAVLHAILRGDPAARDKPGLREVVTRHDGALAGRTLLPLAFHLLGAESFEQRVFGAYVQQITALHPEAELPRVHRTDALLADADALRGRMGDEAFLSGLGGEVAAQASSGWGSLNAAAWTPQSYDAARHAPHGDAARASLVNALVKAYFGSFTATAAYVDMDAGLAEISRHAKSLGYDAVVLFLDELILWLAFGVHEPDFFRREVQKITKLVEGGGGRREIPLVSFIAKQIDLRRWLADAGGSGAQQAALEQSLAFQSGRFPAIELGDANLPYVAHQRLLRPKDAAAEAQIQAAFAGIDRAPGVWRVLLDNVNTDEHNRGADEADFKLTYPFSPALVSTLRALAGAMQRERTALKVMQQMLVDRRESLTVDDLIPVGDAYDLLVNGDALDPAINALFASARELWSAKLRPLLRTLHGTTDEAIDEGAAPAAYHVDARLAKTLLLSAIAPKVPALRALTPERLAHLNHGSIVAPIPGGEAAVVLAKVREWAKTIPEIALDGPGQAPTITLQLTDVDYESIVKKAVGEDAGGRRRQRVQALVAEQLGVDLTAPAIDDSHTRTVLWRGTAREVDLVFGNVRDVTYLPDSAFEARPGTWRFVVDYPFDEAGHTATEDLRRIEGMLARGVDQRTVVWVPHFLTQARNDDLGRLVILEHLLGGTGERWLQYSDHLSEHKRITAKTILQGQRETLRRALLDALQQAYGAAPATAGNLVDDPSHDRELQSLTRSVSVQRPVGAGLGDAFVRLVTQVWDATYPEHPRFELDVAVRGRDLALVQRHVERAMADPDKRVPIEGDPRLLRRIGNPLGVGHTGETHFVFGDQFLVPWADVIDKALARRGETGGAVRVSEARGWVRDTGRGLTDSVADLVILAWAALRRRVWYDAGGQPRPKAPEPGQLQLGMEMRAQDMPTEAEWAVAIEHAAHLFGESGSPFLTPAAVADLADRVRTRVVDVREPVRALVGAVRDGLRKAGVPGHQIEQASRLTTAESAASAVDSLARLQGLPLIRALADLDLSGRGLAMGTSLSSAAGVTHALQGFDWAWLAEPLKTRAGEGEQAEGAAALLNRLCQRLSADEREHPAATALKDADREVRDWLVAQRPVVTPQPSVQPVPPDFPPEVPITNLPPESEPGWPTRAVGGTTRGRGARAATELNAFLREHPEAEVEITWRVL